MSRPPGAARGVLRAPRLVLTILTVAAFASASRNGFVWIDHWQIESGGLIARSWHDLWASLRAPLGSMPGWEGSAPYARPLVIVTLSLDRLLGDLHPLAYHLTVEIIHLANVILVHGVLSALGVAPLEALAAAAIFAVHPLQTAAVAWISGIADPLFTMFVLLAFRLQLAAVVAVRRSLLARIGAVASFLCATAAKETALVFPFLLIAASLFLPGISVPPPISKKGRARAVITSAAPFLVVAAGALLYRVTVLGGGAFGGGIGAIPLDVRLRTAAHLILSYLTLPLRLGALTVCDDYALSTRWDAATLAALGVLAALLAGVVHFRKRQPFIVFGVAWMLLGLLPVLNVVPILHYRADRFFYFPFIGWSLAAIVLIRPAMALVQEYGILSARWQRTGAPLVLALIVGALIILTIRRNALFADDVTLFESTVQVSPLCREAHTTLGDAYLRSGRSADAVVQYQQALAAQPERASYVVTPKVLINLGMAQLERSDFAAAERAFAEAHHLQPELLHPLFGLGVANLGLGRPSAAVDWLRQAYATAPDDPDVVLNLAIGYDRLERPGDARMLYQHYLDISPHGRARPLAQERLRALDAVLP